MPQCIEPSPRVLFQDLEGLITLLDTQEDRYFRLDHGGSRLWRLLVVEQLAPAAAIARLRAEFAVEESALQRDVAAFIEQLRVAGFIEVRDRD